MAEFTEVDIPMSDRTKRILDRMISQTPEIEADRAVLLTESYKETENLPMIKRRAIAFAYILENIPITIRDEELVVGSATKKSRGCQIFPEYSYKWLVEEFDTIAERAADPFYVSEDTKKALLEIAPYWDGKTNSELAESYMTPETLCAMKHNMFTPGNYFYNGIGHVSVNYAKVLEKGYKGIMAEAAEELLSEDFAEAMYPKKREFLESVIVSCQAAIDYAERYAELAESMAKNEKDAKRKAELLQIAKNCRNVPANPAKSFYEACQSFWFVQLLLQTESNGHSISPGRFDQYMYPYYKKDIESGKITRAEAQELIDCLWIKLNDFVKVRDKDSAAGFAGYSLFQNLCVGGQTPEGMDATNDLSYLCIQASMHTQLPQPSFSARIWNGTPDEFILKCAELTRTGVGLPAFYNDEVIIPALMSRGLTMEDARDYNIIGCVEPQKGGKTDGWHDAAFFNMCRPLELVFSNGKENGETVGPETGDVTLMQSFEEFYDAYKTQMHYQIRLMVNADNAIDIAHSERCPLPFQSCMVDDCIKRGKSMQEGGAVYNFTGPQGFGIANMTDSLYAIKKLVFEEKKYTLAQIKKALEDNYGHGVTAEEAQKLTASAVKELSAQGISVNEEQIAEMVKSLISGRESEYYNKMLEDIADVPKYGNDIPEVDSFARDVAYVYTREVEKYKNPRGGIFHAGLYPVSANVPLGQQTGATPDGRLAHTPVADGVGPGSGRDVNGPTSAANSVAKLDHAIASNGTLYNQKFHPSALQGENGLQKFTSYIRAFFDQKGMHVQFNVVSRETLLDAQKHPENYRNLVVRVAGYSALFTTLSKSLQDDIINRTEQAFNR